MEGSPWGTGLWGSPLQGAVCEMVTPFPPAHQTWTSCSQQGFLWDPQGGGRKEASGQQEENLWPRA